MKVLPVNNYASQTLVKAVDGGKTSVEWHSAFYRGFPNNDPPAELNDEAAIASVTGFYKLGLVDLKRKVEAGSRSCYVWFLWLWRAGLVVLAQKLIKLS